MDKAGKIRLLKLSGQALPGHWHKGEFEDGKGNYCGLGIVKHFCKVSPDYDTHDFNVIWTLLDSMVRELGLTKSSGFPTFNDEVAESADDVLKVYKAAIAKLQRA